MNVTSVDTNGPFNAALTINGDGGNDTINLNADITFASNKNLDVDLTNDATGGDVDSISIGANANLTLAGIGTATLKASENITLTSGSSLSTVSGNVTLVSTPTAGTFGITVGGGIITTGGNVTVQSTRGIEVSSGISSGGGAINIVADSDGDGVGNYVQSALTGVVPNGSALHWTLDESPAPNGTVINDVSGRIKTFLAVVLKLARPMTGCWMTSRCSAERSPRPKWRFSIAAASRRAPETSRSPRRTSICKRESSAATWSPSRRATRDARSTWGRTQRVRLD